MAALPQLNLQQQMAQANAQAQMAAQQAQQGAAPAGASRVGAATPPPLPPGKAQSALDDQAAAAQQQAGFQPQQLPTAGATQANSGAMPAAQPMQAERMPQAILTPAQLAQQQQQQGQPPSPGNANFGAEPMPGQSTAPSTAGNTMGQTMLGQISPQVSNQALQTGLEQALGVSQGGSPPTASGGQLVPGAGQPAAPGTFAPAAQPVAQPIQDAKTGPGSPAAYNQAMIARQAGGGQLVPGAGQPPAQGTPAPMTPGQRQHAAYAQQHGAQQGGQESPLMQALRSGGQQRPQRPVTNQNMVQGRR